MGLNPPAISVIVTCFQHGDVLDIALTSVLKQTFGLWECIIVNDGSPDNTEDVAMKWVEKDKRFKYIKQKNGGLSSARNTGFKNSISPYILPLDADDTLPQHTLAKVVEIFNANKEIDFVYGDYKILDIEVKESKIIKCDVITQNQNLDVEKLLKNWILLGTSPCKKELWNLVNGYRLKYSNSVQDVDFWLRALHNDAVGFYANEVIYIWNKSINGMNTTFNRLDYYKLLEENLNFYKKYRHKTTITNEISLGLYKSHCFWKFIRFNIKNLFNIKIKTHLKLLWIPILYIKKKYWKAIVYMPNFAKPYISEYKVNKGTNEPKITIITPSFNQGKYIEETILSVINQNYSNLEYIIIDGGSTDNTIDVIKKYEDCITYWISEKDYGQSNAINKGLRKATGEIVGWLNSDDKYAENSFSQIVHAYKMLKSNKTNYWFIGDCEAFGSSTWKFEAKEFSIADLLAFWKNVIGQPSVFWQRNLISTPVLNEDLNYSMDLDLWLRLSKITKPIAINKTLSYARYYPETKTSSGHFERYREILNVLKKHNKDNNYFYTQSKLETKLKQNFYNDYFNSTLNASFNDFNQNSLQKWRPLFFLRIRISYKIIFQLIKLLIRK